MKLFFPFYMIILGALLPVRGFNQAATGTTQRLDPALRKFIQADFMTRLKDLRREAENGVAAFKLEMNNYKPEDIQKVRTGYEKTADRFNQELENIKNDFLNKKKLKYIVEFPKDYSRSLELNFKELSDFYAQNFQQALHDVRNSKEDGGIAIAILLELVKLAPQVVNHFREMREMAARYDEAYLDKYLITPFKFPAWAEVQTETGYNNFNTYNNNTYNAQPVYPATPMEQVNNSANQSTDLIVPPADTTQQTAGGNWWETNSTVPFTPAAVDGATPGKGTAGKPAVKPVAKPVMKGSPPPDPFSSGSDSVRVSSPGVVPSQKKNMPIP